MTYDLTHKKYNTEVHYKHRGSLSYDWKPFIDQKQLTKELPVNIPKLFQVCESAFFVLKLSS